MPKLGDYISIKHGFAFKGEHITTEDNGVVLVTPGNFEIGGGFKGTKCKFFSSAYPENYVLREGDLIVTMTDLSQLGDTLGFSAKIPRSDRIYLHNQRIGLINIVSDDIDKDYLYWFMRTPSYQRRIVATSSGTTVKHTSPSRICEIEIDLPPIETQRKIASVLSSLDDKIELNDRINANLEAQAKAIFKSWFVDFEPFGGKMPEGWRVASLLDIADYLNGLAMQNFRPEDGEDSLPVLKIKELRQGFCDGSSDRCSPSVRKEYIIRDGDVVFSWSGTLLVDLWCGGTCGLNQHLFKITSKSHEKWFYFMWTKHHLQSFAAVAADKATTMGHIKRKELSDARALIPSKEDYQRISGLLKPLYDLVISNRVENRRLSSLRDALLPRLLSGELDVSNLTI